MKYTVLIAYPPGTGACAADDIYTAVVDVSNLLDPEERVAAALRAALREIGDANDQEGDNLQTLLTNYAPIAVYEGVLDNLLPDPSDTSWADREDTSTREPDDALADCASQLGDEDEESQ